MKNTISIYTAQMSQWRLLKKMGVTLLDVTIKTGVKAFAPRWEDLMAYKNKEMGEEEYTRIYLARMKKSKQLFPEAWNALKDNPSIGVMCYCKPNQFCHRHLFKQLAKDYLEEEGITVELKGEVTDIPILPKQRKILDETVVMRMNNGHLVQHYLMASYCYYKLDQSPMTDHAYDLICRLLTERWDSIEHQHKKYIEFLDGKVGSGFAAVDKYPLMVVSAAQNYDHGIAYGDILERLEPFLNPLEDTND